MNANIFEIKRFAVHDGDGIRTTVFFKGCPLRCIWCHNPEGLSAKPQLAYYAHKCVGCGECARVCPSQAHIMTNQAHVYDRHLCIGCGKCAKACLGDALTFYGKEMTVDELLPLLLEDKAFYENSGGGVTLSGGECLMQADFCAELLKRLKENGIHTAVDTCGSIPENALDTVMPYTDVFLYDIKAYDGEIHTKCTGRSNQQILKNLKYLDECGKNIEIRIPYVPGYNADQVEKIAYFLSDLKHVTKIRVLAYHNYAGSKYAALNIENTLPIQLPTDAEIQKAKDLIKSITNHPVST
ncbi:MAG: glycyl-radical enzyme activating protein [Ruminococcaceae bacterium]|nr:glycyl-radical enzyme activating protein [Oscillospiraceae bacterium]